MEDIKIAGYKDYSMSNNAVDAYFQGEKPLSKWTKAEILQEVEELSLNNFSLILFKKLNLMTLRKYILKYSSWHHTSMHYNKTNFYEIDVEYLRSLTDGKILMLIEGQKLTEEEKAERKAERQKKAKAAEEKRLTKAEQAEKEKLFKYQNKYKTLKGFLNSNLNFEELAEVRKSKIEEKREQLRKEWIRTGCENIKEIESDSFIEMYIR